MFRLFYHTTWPPARAGEPRKTPPPAALERKSRITSHNTFDEPEHDKSPRRVYSHLFGRETQRCNKNNTQHRDSHELKEKKAVELTGERPELSQGRKLSSPGRGLSSHKGVELSSPGRKAGAHRGEKLSSLGRKLSSPGRKLSSPGSACFSCQACIRTHDLFEARAGYHRVPLWFTRIRS